MQRICALSPIAWFTCLLLVASGRSCEGQQSQQASKVHPVLIVIVGGSSPDPAVRMLGYNLPRTGWFNSVIDQRLNGWAAEFKKRGLPFRIQLHNPWGIDGQFPMDFDQRVEASQIPKLDLMVQSFPLWLETRVKPLLGEDGELIIYLGALDVDPDFVALRSKPLGYRQRAAVSLTDVPLWASIAFDHSAEVRQGSLEWSVMQAEIARGRRIYCEARPHANSATVGLPVICDAHLWWRTDPNLYRDARHMAPRQSMRGAEIFALAVRGNHATRQRAHLSSMQNGLTPLFDSRDFWILDRVSR